jgi:aminoacrylate hydrolase
MPRIDIGGLHLNYQDQGTGEPLLMIPGLMGLLDAWDFQVSHFSKRYRCIRFDHRGTGDSDKPKDAYSTRLIAEDTVRLLDVLGIEKAHVIGTSTGGAILQNLAIDHPERLISCVFCNTWTTADEYIRRVQTSRTRIAQSYGPEEYIKFSSLWTCGPNQFRYDWEKIAAIEARQKKTIAPVDVLVGRLKMTLEHDRAADLHRITRPSLIIGTADDPTVPGYFARDLHRAIKGSRLHMMKEGGHYSYRRRHEEFNAVVEKFLKQQSACKKTAAKKRPTKARTKRKATPRRRSRR